MSVHPEPLIFTLPDGAKLGYNVFGSEHLGKINKLPLILVGGMRSLRIDWDPLVAPLSMTRPVLVFDHRGMGDSTFSTAARDDNLTIEGMAQDFLALIEHLGWRDVDILGFSMGGAILQYILLADHPSRTTSPLLRVHHTILTATAGSLAKSDIPLRPLTTVSPRTGQPLTVDQKKELVRPILDASLGPQWVAQSQNRERYEWWLERAIHGRPRQTILKQGKTLGTFDFRQQLGSLSPSAKVLVIHGKNDLIVPFSAGMRLLQSIPHARAVEIGSGRGQVPNYDFGHIWYEYFGVDVWTGVIEAFLDDEYTPSMKSRL